MSERPYDANQLQRLTEHMLARGEGKVIPEAHMPAVDPISTPKATVIHDKGFEHYPSATRELVTAVSGLGRIFTSEGRAERAREKAERAEHKSEVAKFIGDRIINPRTEPDDLRDKIGWVGTNKREVDADSKPGEATKPEEQPEDFSNLGDTLFPKSSKPTRPNLHRPTTRSEIAVDKRMERQIQKSRRARAEARWLSRSYGESLNQGHHRLSRPERRHMRRVSKRTEKLDKKATRAEDRFDIAIDKPSTAPYRWETTKYTAKAVKQWLSDKIRPKR